MSSATRRVRAKANVLMPLATSFVKRNVASVVALRRALRASSMIGGFQKVKVLCPLGEPSSETTLNGRPTRASACFSRVGYGRRAEDELRFEEPYSLQTLRSRRRMLATWDPNTPL